jgi:hypothetical protein
LGKEIEFGAILVHVKNSSQASDTKDVGRELFATSVFQHWNEKDQKIPFFPIVLELGLSRVGKKKPRSIPSEDKVDFLEVSFTRDLRS